MNRWPLGAAAVAAGFLVGAVAFPRAQERISEAISIRHVEPDGGSKPFPVLNAVPPPSAAIVDGGCYEIYFNGSLFVPGLGLRQKLFVQVRSVSSDGWYTVDFGDQVDYKGTANAHVIPVYAPDLEPESALQWRIYYTSIAAVSPNLRASGLDALALQHWPE